MKRSDGLNWPGAGGGSRQQWLPLSPREQDQFIDDLVHGLERLFPEAGSTELFGLAQSYAARERRTLTLNEIAESLSRQAGFDESSSADDSGQDVRGWR